MRTKNKSRDDTNFIVIIPTTCGVAGEFKVGIIATIGLSLFYGLYSTCKCTTTTLKLECRHFDEIFIIGCIESCHFDNFRCNQWWKFRQNDDIRVSGNQHWYIPGVLNRHNLLEKISAGHRYGLVVVCYELVGTIIPTFGEYKIIWRYTKMLYGITNARYLLEDFWCDTKYMC